MFESLNRETILPDDERHWLSLRTEDVTSTESPVLAGVSPYATVFELWHRKKHRDPDDLPEKAIMGWGKRLQDCIAFGIAEDNGLIVRRVNEYIRIPDRRIAASFDFEIIGALPTSPYFHEFQALGPGILEIKNVDTFAFMNGWGKTDFGIEAPSHIELQIQQQMLLMNRRWGIIGPLIGGNRVEPLLRHRHDDTCRGILAMVADFWKTIDANQPPEPDFRADYETIKRIYGYAEPGKVFDGRGNPRIGELLATCVDAGHRENLAKMDKDEAKAELLTIIGNAERVQYDGYSVSCGMVGLAEMAFTRPGYRNVRITKKKDAKL